MNNKSKVFGNGNSSFKILKTIGEGSMGEVYLCREISSDRAVVIKKMKTLFGNASHYEKRFIKEVEVLAMLKHQSIPQFYNFWKENDQLLLSMEYIQGLDLKEIKSHDPSISPTIITMIAWEVLQGLAHAHRRGIIHRDIKPQNLMLSSEGVVKILDFGIARHSDMDEEETDMSLTQPGAIIGTSAYMSPEQANGQNLTTASDLFSLGIVLIELLTGKHPFLGKRSEETMLKISECQYKIPKDTPSYLKIIINTLLQKKPQDRTSAWSILQDLNKRLSCWPHDFSPYLAKYYDSFRTEGRVTTKNDLKIEIPNNFSKSLFLWVFSGLMLVILILERFNFIDFF